ncbi:hypothetical protein [Dyadobacter tibetensis]|uniref:hypothetical protein n=1 Tax=Dyadobacter tibetensis TaxID=1211851 RepID=UPI000472DABF|nr:hypothetical protein [Dyadobacter tibetensis]
MTAVPLSLTELIRQDTFVDWVLHPTSEREAYWQSYLKAFPNQEPVLAAARDYVLLLAIDTGRHKPTADQSSKMWEVVKRGMGKK